MIVTQSDTMTKIMEGTKYRIDKEIILRDIASRKASGGMTP